MGTFDWPFIGLAVSIGFFHTLLGPDHYLPFISLSKARRWSLTQTLLITSLCAFGHVLSSVILGLIGMSLGWAVGDMVNIESQRGTLASWLLLTFGLGYFIWGVRQALIKHSKHHHSQCHDPLSDRSHHHSHGDFFVDCDTENLEKNQGLMPKDDHRKQTFWWLFVIFVFGPCEPLIPVLMYPSLQKNIPSLVAVIIAFTGMTLVTMVSVVLLASFGFRFLPTQQMERWSHSLAGGSISLVALGMIFWGW